MDPMLFDYLRLRHIESARLRTVFIGKWLI